MNFIKVISILVLISFTSTATAAAIMCRSRKVKHAFDVSQGYPKGRKGYVVDHVCALANGGLDKIENMQYQTVEASRAKDRVENTPIGRLLYCNDSNSLGFRTVFNCR
jgi:hypothetical protein